jgi:hypothetical protein
MRYLCIQADSIVALVAPKNSMDVFGSSPYPHGVTKCWFQRIIGFVRRHLSRNLFPAMITGLCPPVLLVVMFKLKSTSPTKWTVMTSPEIYRFDPEREMDRPRRLTREASSAELRLPILINPSGSELLRRRGYTLQI